LSEYFDWHKAACECHGENAIQPRYIHGASLVNNIKGTGADKVLSIQQQKVGFRFNSGELKLN
jgi:hypothetical protein